MSIKRRLTMLEKLLEDSRECPGCAPRLTTTHHKYRLANGEVITLPPIPEYPPCTCGRAKQAELEIQHIIVVFPELYESREAAESAYAEYAAFHERWQHDKEGLLVGTSQRIK
jgi:hypothetical protein